MYVRFYCWIPVLVMLVQGILKYLHNRHSTKYPEISKVRIKLSEWMAEVIDPCDLYLTLKLEVTTTQHLLEQRCL
ncbi:hypothetical protein F5B17DRAFT_393222, partial [Nemania serpens]